MWKPKLNILKNLGHDHGLHSHSHVHSDAERGYSGHNGCFNTDMYANVGGHAVKLTGPITEDVLSQALVEDVLSTVDGFDKLGRRHLGIQGERLQNLCRTIRSAISDMEQPEAVPDRPDPRTVKVGNIALVE